MNHQMVNAFDAVKNAKNVEMRIPVFLKLKTEF